MKSILFNPMNLVVSEQLDCSNVLSDYSSGLEESYFLKTLRFVEESTKEFNQANRVFYKSVLESQGSQVLVHEGFSDFFSAIKKIIDKIIDFIKMLFNKFITMLNAAIKNEKYLIKHKEDFGKFGSNHEFKFDGFDFVFPAGVPSLDTLVKFSDSMAELTFDSLVSKNDTPAKLSAAIRTKTLELTTRLEDREYDKVRADTILKTDNVSQSEYANELFTLFRNDSSSKESIDVTSSKVTEYYSRFEGSKKFENTIKKDRDRIEKEYKSIKKQIDSAIKRTADGTIIDVSGPDGVVKSQPNMNSDVMSSLDLFIKAKSNQIQEISNIHALAFGAKLDAVSDCFKQDKSVLYKALSKIQGTIKKEGE